MKAMLRHAYRQLRKLPAARRLIRHELGALGAQDWSAHILDRFINGPSGAEYGLGPREKAALAESFQTITRNIESGTAPIVHTVLAEAILAIPASEPGVIVECGCWKGASAASLSRVCALTGRKLLVCDSFQGLPDDAMKPHTGLHTGVYGYYKAGMFAGALEEVKHNIQTWGNLEVCTFVEGFFAESLRALEQPVAFAFLDVDLESSMRDCLRALWPLLNEDAFLYSDDAGDLAVVQVFFDRAWWRDELHCEAPGFVGSGCGLPLSPAYSALGYTRKRSTFDPAQWKRAPFLHYPGDQE